jgi:hypothetical protein
VREVGPIGLMKPFLLPLMAGVLVAPMPAQAYVALMAGQTARPLQGTFNNVPVLHSNQPEEVLGPGILVDTQPGSAIAAETNQPLANATYTFNGEFGLHVHHKYFPEDRSQIRGGGARRGELTLATILINPGAKPVHIRFKKGAVRNSFEAPYLANNLMGVKPLGPRPWNTGPGDATAVQMLRGQLDRRLEDEITIPPNSRIVLFSTALPALGIANGLLRGRSDGPFQMAVVAAKNPNSDADILAVLDSRRLAPGRIYLSRVRQIQDGTVFSRVAGVALGDAYTATLNHDLNQGALHVPLTSTNRHHFGTNEVQVNQLATRMLDSSLDNVGTYGVRFDVQLNLQGAGPHQLVLSHPTPNGKTFTAFRGSIGIQSDEGYREVHVGMRSGQSLPIASLNLKPGQTNTVKVSLVYPADATPGHLLSVVPDSQLAQLRQREEMLIAARAAAKPKPAPAVPPVNVETVAVREPVVLTPQPRPTPKPKSKPAAPAVVTTPGWSQPLPAVPTLPGLTPAVITPTRMSQSLMERYQQAVQAQQQLMNSLMGR